MMLFKLLSASHREPADLQVISLTDIGPIGEQIQRLNVPVHALGMVRGRPSLKGLLRLVRCLRSRSPHVVQTWLYHADLIGGLACRLAGDIPVVWGIRNGVLEPFGNKRTTIWTAKLCACLSRRMPKKIVCCSIQAQSFHKAMGYDGERIVVIPNGFDLTAFRPDPCARASVRVELKIPDDALLIGLVARFDPQKDHQNFLRAARMLATRRAHTHFLFCGEGVDEANPQLANGLPIQN